MNKNMIIRINAKSSNTQDHSGEKYYKCTMSIHGFNENIRGYGVVDISKSPPYFSLCSLGVPSRSTNRNRLYIWGTEREYDNYEFELSREEIYALKNAKFRRTYITIFIDGVRFTKNKKSIKRLMNYINN